MGSGVHSPLSASVFKASSGTSAVRSSSGDGWAVLANGQAESYTVETDYAGNATYTFTLREGLQGDGGVGPVGDSAPGVRTAPSWAGRHGVRPGADLLPPSPPRRAS